MTRSKLFQFAANSARSEGARLLAGSSLTTRLDLALRTYVATKRENCSLETQFRAVRDIERLLGEACDALPGLTGLERAALARAMKHTERELRKSVEAVETTS